MVELSGVKEQATVVPPEPARIEKDGSYAAWLRLSLTKRPSRPLCRKRNRDTQFARREYQDAQNPLTGLQSNRTAPAPPSRPDCCSAPVFFRRFKNGTAQLPDQLPAQLPNQRSRSGRATRATPQPPSHEPHTHRRRRQRPLPARQPGLRKPQQSRAGKIPAESSRSRSQSRILPLRKPPNRPRKTQRKTDAQNLDGPGSRPAGQPLILSDRERDRPAFIVPRSYRSSYLAHSDPARKPPLGTHLHHAN